MRFCVGCVGRLYRHGCECVSKSGFEGERITENVNDVFNMYYQGRGRREWHCGRYPNVVES
jgi:hypothetical protein